MGASGTRSLLLYIEVDFSVWVGNICDLFFACELIERVSTLGATSTTSLRLLMVWLEIVLKDVILWVPVLSGILVSEVVGLIEVSITLSLYLSVQLMSKWMLVVSGIVLTIPWFSTWTPNIVICWVHRHSFCVYNFLFLRFALFHQISRFEGRYA